MNAEDKLKLIEEHSSEYYKGRFYTFIKGGFVVMQPMSDDDGYSVYIHDMFVTQAFRGTFTMYKLLNVIKKYTEDNRLMNAYCRVEIANPYLKMLQVVYKKFKFTEIHRDGTAIYYKRKLR